MFLLPYIKVGKWYLPHRAVVSVKGGNMTMGTWVIEPQQINCLDQKDENQEIFQKYNIILGQ